MLVYNQKLNCCIDVFTNVQTRLTLTVFRGQLSSSRRNTSGCCRVTSCTSARNAYRDGSTPPTVFESSFHQSVCWQDRQQFDDKSTFTFSQTTGWLGLCFSTPQCESVPQLVAQTLESYVHLATLLSASMSLTVGACIHRANSCDGNCRSACPTQESPNALLQIGTK